MSLFTYKELLTQLKSWRDQDYRNDVEREQIRVATIEAVLERLLEKLAVTHSDKETV